MLCTAGGKGTWSQHTRRYADVARARTHVTRLHRLRSCLADPHASDIRHVKAIISNCRKRRMSMFSCISMALSRDEQVGLIGRARLDDQSSVLLLNLTRQGCAGPTTQAHASRSYSPW
jgi:hypothetical protein